MLESPKLTANKISIYLLLFFAIWSARELVVQPAFLSPLDNILSELIGESLKLLIWTLPAFLLIKHFHDDMWIGLKEMFTTKPKWFTNAPMLFIVLAPILRVFFIHRTIAIDPDFDPTRLIGGVLFVGITEELVFRGFLLNAFLKKLEMKRAIALNEVFFVLIHYPIWIYNGLDVTAFLTSSVAIFALGVLFSYSFIKTRNIFIPIALHMIWNLFAIVLYT